MLQFRFQMCKNNFSSTFCAPAALHRHISGGAFQPEQCLFHLVTQSIKQQVTVSLPRASMWRQGEREGGGALWHIQRLLFSQAWESSCCCSSQTSLTMPSQNSSFRTWHRMVLLVGVLVLLVSLVVVIVLAAILTPGRDTSSTLLQWKGRGTTKNLREVVLGRCYNYITMVNPELGWVMTTMLHNMLEYLHWNMGIWLFNRTERRADYECFKPDFKLAIFHWTIF